MSYQPTGDLQHPSAVVTMEGLLVEMKNGGSAVADGHLVGPTGGSRVWFDVLPHREVQAYTNTPTFIKL